MFRNSHCCQKVKNLSFFFLTTGLEPKHPKLFATQTPKSLASDIVPCKWQPQSELVQVGGPALVLHLEGFKALVRLLRRLLCVREGRGDAGRRRAVIGGGPDR